MSELETLLGYVFSDKGLLEKALTHSSYSHIHGGENYQILEFLGDRIVDFVIAEELCRRYPKVDEGKLTKMRGAIVSKQPLAQIVEQKGFDKYIKIGFGELESKMRSDVFEALTCAIYLDGGMDEAKAFVLRNLRELIENSDVNSQKDFKSALYEKYVGHSIEFISKGKSGLEHCPMFDMELYVDSKLVAKAQGKSKKEAEQKCAEIFLNTQDN